MAVVRAAVRLTDWTCRSARGAMKLPLKAKREKVEKSSWTSRRALEMLAW